MVDHTKGSKHCGSSEDKESRAEPTVVLDASSEQSIQKINATEVSKSAQSDFELLKKYSFKY